MAELLKISDILDRLRLTEGNSAAEFGCGSATITFALAKMLSKGRVYALDVQEEKISALKGKVAHEHLSNVVAKVCDLESPGASGLHDNSLDAVVIPNLLFQVKDKGAIMNEAIRIAKKGGRILIIDWLGASPLGPKEGLVPPGQVKTLASLGQLTLQEEFAAGDYHYGLLFIKQ